MPTQAAIETTEVIVETTFRPERCAPLYEPGNTDINSPWKRCMGVAGK